MSQTRMSVQRNPIPLRQVLEPVAERAGGQGMGRPGQADEQRRQDQDQQAHEGHARQRRPAATGPVRPLLAGEVLAEREDEQPRQHQSQRLPDLERQEPSQVGHLPRAMPAGRPQGPLGGVEPPPAQKLRKEIRQQDQEVIEQDRVPKAESRADDDRPARPVKDAGVDAQSQHLDDPDAPRIAPPQPRARVAPPRHPGRHQTPRPKASAPTSAIPPTPLRGARSGPARAIGPEPAGTSIPYARKRAISKETGMTPQTTPRSDPDVPDSIRPLPSAAMRTPTRRRGPRMTVRAPRNPSVFSDTRNRRPIQDPAP